MRHHSSVPGWTQHPLWKASTSALSPIWEQPPVLVPLCQHLLVRCPPRSHPTVLQGFRTPATKTVGKKPGFPLLSYNRSLRKPVPHTRVSSETQDLWSRAAGRAVAQLALTRTQLSHLEYLNVLSQRFKSPILQRLLEALGELEVTVGDEASVAGPLPGDKDQGAVKDTLMPRHPKSVALHMRLKG